MFPVTVTIHNMDQLKNVMSALGYILQANQEQAESLQEEGLHVGYQDAARAIVDLTRIKGRDAAVALLAKFNASRLSEVKEEHYAAIVKACEEAINV